MVQSFRVLELLEQSEIFLPRKRPGRYADTIIQKDDVTRVRVKLCICRMP